ncbi:MAG: phosphoenolpyruvate synthase [Elusimicrobia bacterium]|nr:phosphoenolpyruvate synthase [Elusimicrobiota bacterium]
MGSPRQKKPLIRFGSKAETLERLGAVLKTAKVLPQVRFLPAQWAQDPSSILARLRRAGWLSQPLIVRSSAAAEDAPRSTMAGHFKTVLDVRGEAALRKAVAEVVGSYGRGRRGDQAFIQPMLRGVAVSGVAFSRDPNTGGDYLVVNYDDASSRTDTVTSGLSNALKTFYGYRARETAFPSPLDRVARLMRELEGLLAAPALDVEFAVTKAGELYLLQARPLPLQAEAPQDAREVRRTLDDIHRKLCEADCPHPYLHGSSSVFGVMPDWNPAEMIGVRPRPLALSLYREIITDNIWAYQRDNYGYLNLRSFPLMLSFAGLPYIDVRVDFNSFIPKGLDAALARKLVDHYMARLVATPSHHDKVEFKIVFSCYTLDLPERVKVLRRHGFTAQECRSLAETLRSLTTPIIDGRTGLWRQDLERIKHLEQAQSRILDSRLDRVSKIYWLLEDLKRYGTLPFAGLARAAFIAVQLLHSLVAMKVLTRAEYERFIGSLDTVASRLGKDLRSLPRQEFLARYGHLRPGTYDILSPRYDEEPGRYFDWSRPRAPRAVGKPGAFTLTIAQLKRTERLLREHGLDHDVLEFFDFIKNAIEGREHAKFVFTRSLSDALSLFKELGREAGLSLEQCSYADIACVRELYATSAAPADILRKSIEEGRRRYALTRQIVLPPLIVRPDDIWAFHLPPCEPNFITQKSARGPVASAGDDRKRLKGSILFIPGADPGYDWVFSHGMAGLVTMYGGANSHMAIRAGELGIPAVIGAGEALYNQWAAARILELDCANRQVRVIP